MSVTKPASVATLIHAAREHLARLRTLDIPLEVPPVMTACCAARLQSGLTTAICPYCGAHDD